VVLGVVNYFCHRAYSVHETIITKNVSRDLRNQLVHKLQLLSLQYHTRHESGRFFSKIMMDVERTERFADLLFNTFLAAGITVVFTVTVLALDNWRMLLFYLLSAPVYFLLYRFFNRKFTELQRAARLANEDLSQTITQFIQTALLSRIHGEEEFERRRVDRKNVDIIERQTSIRKTIAAFGILSVTFSQAFTMLIVAGCAVLIIRGQMLVGSLVLFLSYATQLTGTITNIMNQFPAITEFAEAVFSIREVLDADDEEPSRGKHKPERVQGRIEFSEVAFAYREGQAIFDGLSVTIEAGTTVALVGPSGSGKSTFVNLALGLLQPQHGSIARAHPFSRDDLRKHRPRPRGFRP
jgi:ATP-binding cassette subfamily B protein